MSQYEEVDLSYIKWSDIQPEDMRQIVEWAREHDSENGSAHPSENGVSRLFLRLNNVWNLATEMDDQECKPDCIDEDNWSDLLNAVAAVQQQLEVQIIKKVIVSQRENVE